ncbi:hypothetical protein Acin_0757 [Acidaminococcus intestini RyC-MR95]|uniref:Uncharacterized protein n=1 Tax=Acidaminococcus intestini (strain RyC-MR95) TaxID=568816 RepID=G4Q508_ACIIR|nr:hypothetical protein Acin_0757 [Acidaminococcus intestini RyC-MR95]
MDCGTGLLTNRHAFLALKRLFFQAKKVPNSIELERFVLPSKK